MFLFCQQTIIFILYFQTKHPKDHEPKTPNKIKSKSSISELSPRTETVRYQVINVTENRKPRIIEEVMKIRPVRRKSNESETGDQEVRSDEVSCVNIEPAFNGADKSRTPFYPDTVHLIEKPEVAKGKSNKSLQKIETELIKNGKDVDNASIRDYEKKYDTKQVSDYPPFDKTLIDFNPKNDSIIENVCDKTEDMVGKHETKDRNPIHKNHVVNLFNKPRDFENEQDIKPAVNIKPVPQDIKRVPEIESREVNKRENLIENRLRRLKSAAGLDIMKLERSKSAVEIEIEKSVKGKVSNIIRSMKSTDSLETPKREVISVKERPRKKSVLEKIALFEVKYLPI